MSKADVMRQMTLADAYNAIARLEEENTLLKGRNEGFEQQIMGLLIKYEEVYKRFPDLKSAMDKAQTILKENAELKDDNKVMADNYSKMEQKFYDNLTKAKEIIKELLFIYYTPLTTESDVKHHHKILEDARQFLKENSIYERIQKAKYNYTD